METDKPPEFPSERFCGDSSGLSGFPAQRSRPGRALARGPYKRTEGRSCQELDRRIAPPLPATGFDAMSGPASCAAPGDLGDEKSDRR
jgi:hypothetical protein